MGRENETAGFGGGVAVRMYSPGFKSALSLWVSNISSQGINFPYAIAKIPASDKSDSAM